MSGKAFEFSTGPLSGKTIRVDLKELQKPLVNRKTSTPMGDRVDRIERRPLDPPPVVSVRIFDVQYEGTPHERVKEIDASTVAYSGFVCHVDMFPVARPERYNGPVPQRTWPVNSLIKWPRPVHDEPSDANDLIRQKELMKEEESELERKKQTSKLFGCSFVNATPIKDLEGVPLVVFVFADLSVRIEGHFVLRYRCFDVFSGMAHQEGAIPVCGEIWGTPFVVVGTKEFPGLKASTELTKHLASYGIPVNWRGYGRSSKQLFGPKEDYDDDYLDSAVTSSEPQSSGGLRANPTFAAAPLAPLPGPPQASHATSGHQQATHPAPATGNTYPSLTAHVGFSQARGDPPYRLPGLGYNPSVRPGFPGFRAAEFDAGQQERAAERTAERRADDGDTRMEDTK